MANWCRGILKIRGTKENIVKCEEDVIEIEEQQVDVFSVCGG